MVDPEHRLADVLRERGLLDVAVTKRTGYEHGLAQPAVLVQKGRGDGTVLFDWAIVPGVVCFGVFLFPWSLAVLGQMHLRSGCS